MKILNKVIYTTVLISLIGTSYVYANTEYKNYNKDSNFLTYYSYKQVNVNDIFTIEEKTDNENTELFKADIKYPYLKIKNNYNKKDDTQSKIIENINSVIIDTVTTAKDKIKKDSEEYKKSYEADSNKNNTIKYQYEAVYNYKTTYNKNNILSIPLTMYEFTGGAHGLTNIKSFNYDLVTGKELKLEDLFKANSNYKEFINKHIEEEIVKQPEIYFQGQDGFSSIKDNQDFYISDEGIVIYFSLYDIAPYSSGIPMFTITWDEIIDYLENPNIIK
ncbi:MAG: DUF3298 and DUF4163 domain-containing protein [Peptostreptococcaceae bacterium]|nr:DUF3298 and DUF4163 domain-containing protein [Peptostreptococcaceae bacterium]